MNAKFFLTICLPFLVSSCFMGELGIYGQAREDYLKSIKPMRDFWKKEGTSDESRAQDWVACGGTKNGDFSPYEKDLEAEESKSGLDFFKAYMQLLYKVQRCMRNQGYRFIGECYDTFESKETPACGGP